MLNNIGKVVPTQLFYRVINGKCGIGSTSMTVNVTYDPTTEVITGTLVNGTVTAYNCGDDIETATASAYFIFDSATCSQSVSATATCSGRQSMVSSNISGVFSAILPAQCKTIDLVFYLYSKTGEANPEGDIVVVRLDSTDSVQGYPDPISYTPEELQIINQFGNTGVHKSTGNYSETAVDMTIESPGFKLNFSRTYNSKDTRDQKLFSKGWTFGFEGTIKVDTLTVVRLPDGSSMSFNKSTADIFTAVDNRSTVIKNPDGTFQLTTKDQYKYIFNASGFLVKMIDKFGNIIQITTDPLGKVTRVLAGTAEDYQISYNAEGKVVAITEVASQRKVEYIYTGGILTKVKDPMLFETNYSYDPAGFLSEVRDHNGNILRAMSYNHVEADIKDKLTQLTDSVGNKFNYTYEILIKNTVENKNNYAYVTTVKDSNNRISKTSFDDANYPCEKQDADNLITTTTYFKEGELNKFGEVKTITDRNGNVTTYERDTCGNITKVIMPDSSAVISSYDSKNNKILEIDELGNRTEYIYDPTGLYLLKMVKPLNGQTVYQNVDTPTVFAITNYDYHSYAPSAPFYGLLKSVTSPEGSVTTYTYTTNGNVATVTDPETGGAKTYLYDSMDLLCAEVSALGKRKEFVYTKNRQLYKSIEKGTNNLTQVNVYDHLGRKTKVVGPEQYIPTDDGGTNIYNGAYGHRYTYSTAGHLIMEIDPMNSITQYENDNYGNVKKITKPDGAIYEFTYDVMNRMISKTFKETIASPAQILETWTYSQTSGKVITTQTIYLTATETAVTISEYDYAGRLIKVTNPDGSIVTNTYYANGLLRESVDALGYKTKYQYDTFGNLTKKWTSGDNLSGTVKFRYDRIDYDKDNNKIADVTSADWVAEGAEPLSTIRTSYTYYKNGKLKTITDPKLGLTTHYYNNDGEVTHTQTQIDTGLTELIEYVYDANGFVSSKTITAANGDFAPNAPTDTGVQKLITQYFYDTGGRLIKEIAPDNTVVEHSYDALDRKLGTWTTGIDENGAAALVKESYTYTYDGQVKTAKDALGNTVTNIYSGRGFLVRTDLPMGLSKAFEYDLAGRTIREVLPNAYVSTKTPAEVAHVRYVYDKLSRVIEQYDAFTEKVWQAATSTWVATQVNYLTKAYSYDALGRVNKEVDADQYEKAATTGAGKFANAKGTQYTYTPSGQLRTALTAADKDLGLVFSVTNTYDALGRKISETDALGQLKVYTYDAESNVTQVGFKKTAGSPETVLETRSYDYAGHVKSVTNALNNSITYAYNALGLLKQEVHPADETLPSLTITYQYDKVGQLVRKVDSLSQEDLYTYDFAGRVLTKKRQKVGAAQVLTKAASYDLVGNIKKETDPSGNVTTKTYDALKRLITVSVTVKAANKPEVLQTTTFTYDKNGNKLTEKNWLNNQIEMIYDGSDRLVEKKDPLGNSIEKHTYNKADVAVLTYDAKNGMTSFEYDSSQRLVKTTDAEGFSVSQSYDSLGRVKEKRDGKNNLTKYEYDDLGRLSKVTNALNQSTTYAYDNAGNLLVQTEAGGKTTTYVYGVRNQVKKRFEHGGLVGGVETANLRTSYLYSADGSVLSETDRKGQVTSQTQDLHGRILNKTVVGEAMSFTYDNNGNILTVIDNTGTTTKTYDSLGRMLSETSPNTGTSTWDFDILTDSAVSMAVGEVAVKTTDAKGGIVLRVLDKNGRLSKVVDVSNTNATTTYLYDLAGNQSELSQPNGAKSVYTYDKNHQVKTLNTYKADASLLESYTYVYDAARNQTSKMDRKGTTTYTYDGLNRLQKVMEPSGKETTYSYDASGNRAVETSLYTGVRPQGYRNTRNTYTYNALNQLLELKTEVQTPDPSTVRNPMSVQLKAYLSAVVHIGEHVTLRQANTTVNVPAVAPASAYVLPKTSPSTPTITATGVGDWVRMESSKYQYDPNGNQLTETKTIYDEGSQRVIATEVTTHIWDSQNRLTEHKTQKTVNAQPQTKVSQYKYNAEGKRVEKSVDTIITRYLYEGKTILLELAVNGAVLAKNIHGLKILKRNVSGKELSYFFNAHGDVTALLDRNGVLSGRYDYDAFGNLLEETDGQGNPYKYAGYEHDSETGLYNLRARYYSAKVARFISEDTNRGRREDPLSLNLYTYCHNEPIRYVDPSGHREIIGTDKKGKIVTAPVKSAPKVAPAKAAPVVKAPKVAPKTQPTVKVSAPATKTQLLKAIVNENEGKTSSTLKVNPKNPVVLGTPKEVFKEKQERQAENTMDKSYQKTKNKATVNEAQVDSLINKMTPNKETHNLSKENNKGFVNTIVKCGNNLISHPIETIMAVGGIALGFVGIAGSGLLEVESFGALTPFVAAVATLSANSVVSSTHDLANIAIGKTENLGKGNLLLRGFEGAGWVVGEAAESLYERFSKTDIEISDSSKNVGKGLYYGVSLFFETKNVANGFERIMNKYYNVEQSFNISGNIYKTVPKVTSAQKTGAVTEIIHQVKSWWDAYSNEWNTYMAH